MEEKNRRDALLAAVRFGRAAHAARLALATPPRPAPAAAPSRVLAADGDKGRVLLPKTV